MEANCNQTFEFQDREKAKLFAEKAKAFFHGAEHGQVIYRWHEQEGRTVRLRNLYEPEIGTWVVEAEKLGGRQVSMLVLEQVELSIQRIQHLLISAFEGGSNYWYSDLVVCYDKTDEAKQALKDVMARSKREDSLGDGYGRIYCAPFAKGCWLTMTDSQVEPIGDKPKRFRLGLEEIHRGLRVMQEQYGRHFGDWLAENDDATTGDVFLQCCLFGEVHYG